MMVLSAAIVVIAAWNGCMAGVVTAESRQERPARHRGGLGGGTSSGRGETADLIAMSDVEQGQPGPTAGGAEGDDQLLDELVKQHLAGAPARAHRTVPKEVATALAAAPAATDRALEDEIRSLLGGSPAPAASAKAAPAVEEATEGGGVALETPAAEADEPADGLRVPMAGARAADDLAMVNAAAEAAVVDTPLPMTSVGDALVDDVSAQLAAAESVVEDELQELITRAPAKAAAKPAEEPAAAQADPAGAEPVAANAAQVEAEASLTQAESAALQAPEEVPLPVAEPRRQGRGLAAVGDMLLMVMQVADVPFRALPRQGKHVAGLVGVLLLAGGVGLVVKSHLDSRAGQSHSGTPAATAPAGAVEKAAGH